MSSIRIRTERAALRSPPVIPWRAERTRSRRQDRSPYRDLNPELREQRDFGNSGTSGTAGATLTQRSQRTGEGRRGLRKKSSNKKCFSAVLCDPCGPLRPLRPIMQLRCDALLASSCPHVVPTETGLPLERSFASLALRSPQDDGRARALLAAALGLLSLEQLLVLAVPLGFELIDRNEPHRR